MRLFDGKLDKIDDPAALAQVRQQARGVVWKAFLVGLALTLLVLALPR